MTYLTKIEDLSIPARQKATRTWTVHAPGPLSVRLGVVKWYSPWRRFAFLPDEGTVYEADCLEELAGFCRLKTQERKAERVKP